MYRRIHIRQASLGSFQTLLAFFMLLFVSPLTLLQENAAANHADWLADKARLKKVAIFEVFSKDVVIN